MRIKVPVEMLYEAASRLSKMEATLAQDSNQLVKIWNSLPLESRSKQTMDTKISQVRSLAGRLSSQANSLGNYLNLAGMRFVEADRHCSEGGLKGVSDSMQARAGVGAGSNIIAERAKYETLEEEYDSLGISREDMDDPPIVRALGFYGDLRWAPYSGVAGTAVNIGEDIFYDNADAASIAGTGTVGVAGMGLSGAAGTAAKFAVGKALIGTSLVATAPVWVTGAVAVGAGVAVGYGVSKALDITIGDNTISGHAGDAMASVYRSAGEMASSVGSSAVQAGASVVDSVSSGIQSAGESVGSAVESAGEMARGVGEKLKFW